MLSKRLLSRRNHQKTDDLLEIVNMIDVKNSVEGLECIPEVEQKSKEMMTRRVKEMGDHYRKASDHFPDVETEAAVGP